MFKLTNLARHFAILGVLAAILGVYLLAIPTAVAIECGTNFTVRHCVNQLAGTFKLPQLSAYKIIQEIIAFLLAIAAAIATLAIIIGGIMYIMSIGDDSKTARAKKVLLYAVLGLLIVGAARLIVSAVGLIF